MKVSIILAAALMISVAPLALANAAIQKEAQAKNPSTKYACTVCHAKLPGSKTNLTDEGKKWVKP
jgi:cytochrome c553